MIQPPFAVMARCAGAGPLLFAIWRVPPLPRAIYLNSTSRTRSCASARVVEPLLRRALRGLDRNRVDPAEVPCTLLHRQVRASEPADPQRARRDSSDRTRRFALCCR